MRKMVPVRSGKVREALGIRRAELAYEAGMQPGMIAWIETGRFVPYESQLEKIAAVFRKHGWAGEVSTLLDEAHVTGEEG